MTVRKLPQGPAFQRGHHPEATYMGARPDRFSQAEGVTTASSASVSATSSVAMRTIQCAGKAPRARPPPAPEVPPRHAAT